MRHWRDDEVAGILETYEAAVEQVVDAGRHEQSILPVQPLVVRRIPLGLTMAGDEVNRVLDSGDPAPPLDFHYPLLEKALPAPRPDDSLPISVSD